MALRLNLARRVGPTIARHPLRFAGLVALVVAVHGCVTRELADRMAALAESARMPPRLEVAYVRTLEPEAPKPVAAPAPPPPAPARRVQRAHPPRVRASAPEPTASAPEAPASAPEALARAASAAPAEPASSSLVTPETRVAAASAPSVERVASGAAAAASAASSVDVAASGAPPVEIVPARGPADVQPFDWPASTRVTYLLTGYYRGDVTGSAQVEWIRIGLRYQVNLDFIVGPEFAPIIHRRMTSEGDLTADGLTPARYDEETQVAFHDPRHVALRFEGGDVVLANGERRERWRGVQDTASQFVQLTYLFTLHPELLQAGRSVEVPLALARSVSRWTYDVLEETELQTPFGLLPAVHLRPRRDVVKPGDLTAEIWFSPQLRYLPVRIRVAQDAQNYVDLVIARKPDLAAR
jgi:hypothetical protein